MTSPHFSSEQQPIKLYYAALSGHANRVKLFLSLLDLPYEIINVDLRNGEQKAPEFLKLNPFGQVPVIDDNATEIWDSNAILVYLAQKYDVDGKWLPKDPVGAAQVQQWLSVAAGPLASGPATARVIKLLGRDLDYDLAAAISKRLLKTLELELADRLFLVGDGPTIADISLYTYVAHAPEGEIDLTPYSNVRAWLSRISSLDGFVGMQAG